jgi:proton-translocating NADH-quinone oxidoreductase chain N
MTVDLFNLFVFFEVVSISSYALAVVNKEQESIEGAFKYLVIGALGGVFLLLGIILTYQVAGSLNLAVVAEQFSSLNSGLKWGIFTCYLVGFGVKTALIPFHPWLPDVYSKTLVTFSVLSSGLIIKVSLYNLFKVMYSLFEIEVVVTSLRPFLTWWGTLTFLVAHLLAYQQTNLRRLLGYSSIAQIGYIMLAFGLGTEAGVVSGNYHLLNHALMKGTLFLAAGIFTFRTNAHKLEEIRGLGYKLPIASLFFTIASFAIVGLPPFNGFISKWLIMQAALEVDLLIPAFFVLVGTVLAAGYYLRVIKLLYSREKVEQKFEFKPVSWKLTTPTVVLGSLCLILGLFPQLIFNLVQKTTVLLGNNYLIILGGG